MANSEWLIMNVNLEFNRLKKMAFPLKKFTFYGEKKLNLYWEYLFHLPALA